MVVVGDGRMTIHIEASSALPDAMTALPVYAAIAMNRVKANQS